MWPIGRSSCDQTGLVANKDSEEVGGMILQNASIGALKTEKKWTTDTNFIRPFATGLILEGDSKLVYKIKSFNDCT